MPEHIDNPLTMTQEYIAGMDPDSVLHALDRFTQLLAKLPKGRFADAVRRCQGLLYASALEHHHTQVAVTEREVAALRTIAHAHPDLARILTLGETWLMEAGEMRRELTARYGPKEG